MGLRILYNSLDPSHKTPFGVLTPGEVCRMTIAIPRSCQTVRVILMLERENGEPYRELEFQRDHAAEPYEYYRLHFSLPAPGLFYYYFRITTRNEQFRLLKQEEDTNIEDGSYWQLSCVSTRYPVPPEYEGRVFYQIFPDRFHQSGRCDLTDKLQPYWIHQDVTDPPVWRPNERGEVLNNDFYGGNLRGIQEKLPYLKALGVGALYLNPIFMAYSSHRYDTADYSRIDPMLGTDEDFKILCDAAHDLGMKIILDGVFSHTGSNSIYFDAEHIFGNGAVSDPHSPYRSWYLFRHYPNDYESWWGFHTLPCLNKRDPGFIDYIFGSDDSILAKWLRLGADGLRLDVVDELPDDFLMALRVRLRELNPNALLIGEVWEDASNKISYGVRRRYFTEAQLDSVMNYPWRKAILAFARGEDDGPALRRAVLALAENYPAAVLNANLNLLSSHDVPRALTALVDPTDGEREDLAQRTMTAEQLALGKVRLRLASFLQFTLPGAPCIYYGDEAGMRGYRDPFNRCYYPWGQEDLALIEHYRALARLKNGSEALRRGSVEVLESQNGHFVFRRRYGKEMVTLWCNASPLPWCAAPSGKLLLGDPNLPSMGFCAMETRI